MEETTNYITGILRGLVDEFEGYLVITGERAIADIFMDNRGWGLVYRMTPYK